MSLINSFKCALITVLSNNSPYTEVILFSLCQRVTRYLLMFNIPSTSLENSQSSLLKHAGALCFEKHMVSAIIMNADERIKKFIDLIKISFKPP